MLPKLSIMIFTLSLFQLSIRCEKLKKQAQQDVHPLNSFSNQEEEIAEHANLVRIQSNRKDSIKPENKGKQVKGTTDYYLYTYSYEIFKDYFIVSTDDSNIRNIKQIVKEKFSSFIDCEKIIAAFRKYVDENIQYRVVYKSDFRKNFQVFIMYDTEDQTFQLKELVPLKLSGIRTNTRNCAVSEKFVCIQCDPNFQLYKGRCHLVQKQCLNYEPEQCMACTEGYTLQRGQCVQGQ